MLFDVCKKRIEKLNNIWKTKREPLKPTSQSVFKGSRLLKKFTLGYEL